MKLGVALGCLALVAGPALGQGLGDVAKKEQQRRKENKEKGLQARTFSDQDLGGGSSTAGASSDAEADDGADGSSASNDSASARTPGDDRRAAGKRKLDSIYARIAAQASDLVALAEQYVGKGCGSTVSDECGSLGRHLGSLACAVGRNLDEANDLARQSWLLPGDVRELRDRYGLEERLWYDLSSLARQHCRG